MTVPQKRLDEDLCVHIFTASAGMVGVCLTVIGIIRIVISMRQTDTVADDLLAADALLYLIACFLAYFALRTRSVRRNHRLEQAADVFFLVALLLTVAAASVITWAIST
jgi:branched-subunit amino acid permease